MCVFSYVFVTLILDRDPEVMQTKNEVSTSRLSRVTAQTGQTDTDRRGRRYYQPNSWVMVLISEVH